MIKAAGFLLGFVGLVVLIGPTALLQLRGEGGDLWYQLAALAGAICYAVNAIIARHRPPADPLVAAAGVMIMGSLVMLPIGGPAAPRRAGGGAARAARRDARARGDRRPASRPSCSSSWSPSRGRASPRSSTT